MAATQETQLFQDVARGENSSVGSILDQGISPNVREPKGQTLLMFTSYFGHLNIVKTLSDRGVDVNAADKAGFTALITAIEQGHSEVVEELLERQADMNAVHHATKQSPLYTAARRGNSSIALSLVQHGASVDDQDWRRHTALSVASQEGYFDCVRILTDNGASVELGHSDGGWSLHHAAKNYQTRVVELLIEKLAVVDLDQVDNVLVTSLMRAAQYGADDLRLLIRKNGEG